MCKHEHPDAIINIVDATNLSRSLFFTTQLLELGIPVGGGAEQERHQRKEGRPRSIQPSSVRQAGLSGGGDGVHFLGAHRA